ASGESERQERQRPRPPAGAGGPALRLMNAQERSIRQLARKERTCGRRGGKPEPLRDVREDAPAQQLAAGAPVGAVAALLGAPQAARRRAPQGCSPRGPAGEAAIEAERLDGDSGEVARVAPLPPRPLGPFRQGRQEV